MKTAGATQTVRFLGAMIAYAVVLFFSSIRLDRMPETVETDRCDPGPPLASKLAAPFEQPIEALFTNEENGANGRFARP